MHKNQISVIIPMYNAEAFIRQSVQSVLAQTYQDFEIMVLDDGSTDRGPDICEQMGQADGRIHLYRRPKMGVSAARNFGMEKATGEYVFFLDSDDAIHPRLFEEMVCQMQGHQAGMAFCGYEKVESGHMDLFLEGISREARPVWQVLSEEETEVRFHDKYAEIMAAIGGKMIRADLVCDLRFDEDLINGEDTLFLYRLVSLQIRSVFSAQRWYYYRMHPGSVIHSPSTVCGKRYFECVQRIRDMEYQKDRFDYLLRWQGGTVNKIQRNYIELKRAGDKNGCRKLKQIAKTEQKHPFYVKLPFINRLLFGSCFGCSLLFHGLRKFLYLKRIFEKKLKPNKANAKVGILTFHCSDNFGAMLQAYGLKTYLCGNGIPTEIVRYAPAFMTGRHWLIPYVPGKWKKGLRGMKRAVRDTIRQLKGNRALGEAFFIRREKMQCFREKYLIDQANARLLSDFSLSKLTYPCYVVGSDQIWNPDITFGMRKAYFGAFKNKKKKKVVAYAASFGGASLAPQYGEEFSRLIQQIDAVSVREEEAVAYVKAFYKKEVAAVLDPVFFLKKADWQKVEEQPSKTGYIFVYITEINQELSEYVRKLSQEKRLPVIEVSAGRLVTGAGFTADYSVGPSEFLGYIHHADYVVSNSFHAVAFSIIYQKKFIAFAHSNRGARLRNILQIHGLGDRLCQTGGDADIEKAIDWVEVERNTEEHVRKSGEFLINSILK